MNNHLIIAAEGKNRAYLSELYSSLELLFFFCWRDCLVRYRQAYFGIAWALIRPLLNMVLFTYFFGRLAGLNSMEVNYPLFVLVGMLPWQLFANSISENCLCLVNNTSLITKIYFPRMILPLSQIIVQMVDFLINLTLVFILSFFLISFNLKTLVFLPLCILLTLILTVGTGLWLSAITVFYRDVRFIVPFLVQFGMFVSPVGYGSFVIKGWWKWLYNLNPMVGIIDSYRYAFFGISYPDMPVSLFFSCLFSFMILITGFLFFRYVETSFADKI